MEGFSRTVESTVDGSQLIGIAVPSTAEPCDGGKLGKPAWKEGGPKDWVGK